MDDGTGDKVKGKVKETTGEVTDDERLEQEGRLDQAKGKIKSGVDKVTDKIDDKNKAA